MFVRASSSRFAMLYASHHNSYNCSQSVRKRLQNRYHGQKSRTATFSIPRNRPHASTIGRGTRERASTGRTFVSSIRNCDLHRSSGSDSRSVEGCCRSCRVPGTERYPGLGAVPTHRESVGRIYRHALNQCVCIRTSLSQPMGANTPLVVSNTDEIADEAEELVEDTVEDATERSRLDDFGSPRFLTR